MVCGGDAPQRFNCTVDQFANAAKIEKAKRDVQDVEFTIENGKLYILQTRNAKRTNRKLKPNSLRLKG